MNTPINVAVVTGGHPYDVPGLTDMFRALPDINAYPQHMEDFATDPAGKRTWYDVVLFYTMLQQTPTGEGAWYEAGVKTAIEDLGESGRGIFMLHHAILAYPGWPLWHSIVGVRDYVFKNYHIGERPRIATAKPDHPITQGLTSWEMTDETYEMSEPDQDNEILLTIDHPKSMRACAWVRQHKNARVFCYQSGHDNETYAVPNFRTVVARGIQWCARRI